MSNQKTRQEITKILSQAAVHYLVKKGFSVSQEIGLNNWGRRRADLLALNLKGEIIICEVKSCREDFTADKKYEQYLPFCNKMYFVISDASKSWMQKHVPHLKKLGIGVLALTDSGYCKVRVSAKSRVIDPPTHLSIVIRLAWRGGAFSKRTVTRRQRLYL